MQTLLSCLAITGFGTYADFYPDLIRHESGDYEAADYESTDYQTDSYVTESGIASGVETKLLSPLVFERAVSDSADGAPGNQRITAELSNINLSKIPAPRQLLGVTARGELWDVENNTRLEVQTGIITEINCGPERMDLTIEQNVTEPLQTLIPKRRVRDVFPSADFSTLPGGGDPSIIIPWGTMYKIPLPLCQRPYLHAEFQMHADAAGYLYLDMTDIPDYIVQPGDKLQYDIRDPFGGSQIALDLGASDGTNLRDTGAVDQNGLSCHPITNLDAVAFDRWYRREIPLTTMASKTIITYTLACECDTTRGCLAWIGNARIVDSQGDLRLTIFDEQTVTGFTVTGKNPITNDVGLLRRDWWDYGPIRCTSLIVRSAYRGTAVITPGTFTLEEPLPGMRTIRFTEPQLEVNGERAAISLTFSTEDFGTNPNPARIKQYLLSDFADGAGVSVDPISFGDSALALTAAGIFAEGGLSSQRPAIDVISDLCFYGEEIGMTESGAYTDTADSLSLHTLNSLHMGEADGQWENVSFAPASYRMLDQIKSLTLKAYLVSDFGGSETYAVSASRSAGTNGSTLTQEEPYLSPLSVDREVYYRFTKNRSSSPYKAEATAKMQELLSVKTNDLVIIHIPNDPDIDGRTMRVVGRTCSADNLSFSLRGYDAATYSYVSVPVNATGVPPLIDYRFTIPGSPTNFIVWVQNVQVTSDGSIKTYVTVQADAPPTNVTELKFQAVPVGSVLFTEIPVVVSPGQTNVQAVFALEPGLTYNYRVFAYNGMNAQGYRYSPAAQILSHTVDGDTIPPSSPTGVSVRQSGAKTVEISIAATTPPDWGTTHLYRNTTNSSGSASLIDSGKKLSFHDQNISYNTTYFYWAKIVDTTGNQSGFSPSSGGILISRLVNDDYSDDSISTNKYQSLSITSAKIGSAAITTAKIAAAAITTAEIANLAVTNAKINDLSAAKITTGLLTVNPFTAGATAIFIDSAGRIRLKSMVGVPAKISFEDGAGLEKAGISGSTDGSMVIEALGPFLFVLANETIFGGSIETGEYRGTRKSGSVGANSGYMEFTDGVTDVTYKIQLHL